MAGAIMIMNSTTYSNPPPPPPAPVLISPTNGSGVKSTSVTFTWSASGDATNYQIRVSTDPNVEDSLFHDDMTGGATSKNYTDFPNDGTVYYWKVRAYNVVGWGSWSTVWYFINGEIPVAPVLISPTNGSKVVNTSITFVWNTFPGATDYQIRVSTDSGAETDLFHDDMTGGATSKNYTDFPNDGTVYYWKVRACNPNGCSDWSTIWYFINGDIPTIPVLISPINASKVKSTSVTFEWSASSGATNYHIKVSTDPGAETNLFHESWTSATSKNYTDFPNDGTVYYWKVRAYNVAGWSDWSMIWHFHNGETSAIILYEGDTYRKFDFDAEEIKLFKFIANSGPVSPILAVVTEVPSHYSDGNLHMMVKYAGQNCEIGPPTEDDYNAILAIIEADWTKYKGIYNGIYYHCALFLTKRIYIKYPEQITDGCWYFRVNNIHESLDLENCMVHFRTR